jgi:putative ATP-dependent endonuclease of the OLD family
MYISKLTIENFRCFGEGENKFEISLRPGLTTLVGENDTGKSAIIDALRFVLGTTDQEWYRLEETDFYIAANPKEIRIVCKFEALGIKDQTSFIEFLTYDPEGEGPPVLYLTWTAKETGEITKGRPYRRVEIHSGKNGDGPTIDLKVRELLAATYLRPLRDAEKAMSSGRGSRLSQVLHHSEQVRTSGVGYNPQAGEIDVHTLNVLGIGDLANDLLTKQKGIIDARDKIDAHLKGLSLKGGGIASSIKVSGANASDETRLRLLLEKLDLSINGNGKLGLGSNNLLFMACELLLLAQEDEGNKMLLIEEPEAHLHPQRQLRVMKTLQEQGDEKGIQIIVTTHSPNLASAVALENIILIHENRAFSMAKASTKLEPSDYRFLQRFLDATKANLFFARGVMIVEGDAENILMPTLAKLIGRDFTEHGVSIVNVGGVGLRRYARIFLRADVKKDGPLRVPVACLTDLDVMPDCAPLIIGIKEGDEWPPPYPRRWRAKRDYGPENPLDAYLKGKISKANEQQVRTFVSDEWTLEYNLALGPKKEDGTFPGGLPGWVFVAACLAKNDEKIHSGKKKYEECFEEACTAFAELSKNAEPKEGCSRQEVLATEVYALFARDNASKSIAAQYLSELLVKSHIEGYLTTDQLKSSLPSYLVAAIDYVTGFGPEIAVASMEVKNG